MGGVAIQHLETFSLIAELALGLAGFAGVVVAFVGRERSYEAADRARLLSLFGIAAIALAGSLLTISLAATGMAVQSAYWWVSAFGILAVGGSAIAFLPGAYRSATDPDASTELWAVAVSTALLLANLLLLGGNLVLGGKAWPLKSAFSSQLVCGLWIFIRLLTRRG